MKEQKHYPKLLLISLGIFLIFGSYGVQANGPDPIRITQNTNWTKDMPNLIFNTQVFIENGATLTIEKGTTVVFHNNPDFPFNAPGFQVSGGKIYANGTKEEPITVTSPDDGFVFNFYDNTQISFLRYVNIENGGFIPLSAGEGGDLVPHTDVMTVEGGKIRMENSSFINSRYDEINIMDSYVYDADGNPIIDASDNYVENKSQVDIINSNFSYRTAVNSQLDCWLYDESLDKNYIDQECTKRVYLKDDWYGDSAGPTTDKDENEGVLKGYKVSGFHFLDSWRINDEIIETDTPICTENCFSNVLFLPGLEASRLYKDENQLWEPNRNADVEKLFLDENGKSLDPDVYTKDVLDEVNVLPLGQKNIYKSFLADLAKWKNEEGIINDYLAVPYDWRLSLEDILTSGAVTGDKISYTQESISPYIVRELRRLAETSKSGKVTIVAHSNGGLLAKVLTNKLGAEAESLIDKIVMVAVPQVGTPQAIGGLLHGYDQGLPTDWMPLLLSPKTARTLANNMPSAYNLLPADAYFNGDGSSTSTPVISFENGSLTQSFISKYGNEINNPTELHNFILDSDGKVAADSDDVSSPSTINSKLLQYGEDVHQVIDDNWTAPASIAIYQIAGFGEETLGEIKYWTGIECVKTFHSWCLEYKDKIQYTPQMVIDGDGTVVMSSALAMSTDAENVKRYWVDLDEYNKNEFDREHADILEVSELRSFIKDNILTKSNSALPDYISDSKPLNSSEKRLHYILHSPLTLSAHDTNDNEISATNATIAGATYRRFGEVQYLSLPASIPHTLLLNGIAEGSFTLEMQEIENNVIVAETTFSGVPTLDKTKVTMEVTDGTIGNASLLVVDYDGDETIDFSLQPKVGETVMQPVLDQTPPEARIFFDPQTNSIVVEGIDENPTTVAYSAVEKTGRNKKQKDKIIVATITDQANNTTIVTYTEKFQNAERKAIIKLNSVSYNGEVVEFSGATLGYKWNGNKNGKYKMFASYLQTASASLESHYRPRKNITLIMTNSQELDDRRDDIEADRRPLREKLPGMVIPELTTKQGVLEIKY